MFRLLCTRNCASLPQCKTLLRAWDTSAAHPHTLVTIVSRNRSLLPRKLARALQCCSERRSSTPSSWSRPHKRKIFEDCPQNHANVKGAPPLARHTKETDFLRIDQPVTMWHDRDRPLSLAMESPRRTSLNTGITPARDKKMVSSSAHYDAKSRSSPGPRR